MDRQDANATGVAGFGQSAGEPSSRFQLTSDTQRVIDARSGARRNGHVPPGLAHPSDATLSSGELLLARVLARLPNQGPYLVQFLPLEGMSDGSASSAFCQVAAARLGPALRLEAVGSSVLETSLAPISPDTSFPRLSHSRLTIHPTELVRRGRSALLHGNGALPANYDMIAVDCHGLEDKLATVISSVFSGTILIARAGVTKGREIRETSREVQQLGGLVLGVALSHVPRGPSWIRWLGA